MTQKEFVEAARAANLYKTDAYGEGRIRVVGTTDDVLQFCQTLGMTAKRYPYNENFDVTTRQGQHAGCIFVYREYTALLAWHERIIR